MYQSVMIIYLFLSLFTALLPVMSRKTNPSLLEVDFFHLLVRLRDRLHFGIYNLYLLISMTYIYNCHFINLTESLCENHLIVYVMFVFLGGSGVVYTLTVPGRGCRLTAVCCQLCLQPPAHLTSGHHGTHRPDHPVLYRYKHPPYKLH